MENTIRIRRDTLMELLETEAPVEDQRITARMPVVTLSDLLAAQPALPPPDPDTFEPPTSLYVRAVGTNQALQRLELDPSMGLALKNALEALMTNERPFDPSRLPTEPMPAALPPFELVALAEDEIERALAPLHEREAMASARMLVVAASCTLTILLALIFSLL